MRWTDWSEGASSFCRRFPGLNIGEMRELHIDSARDRLAFENDKPEEFCPSHGAELADVPKPGQERKVWWIAEENVEGGLGITGEEEPSVPGDVCVFRRTTVDLPIEVAIEQWRQQPVAQSQACDPWIEPCNEDAKEASA